MSWIASLTGVPLALVDLIEDELRQRLLGDGGPAGHCRRRVLHTGAQLFALACIGACVVATAERAVALSVAAAAGATIAVYRRPRAGAAIVVGLTRRRWSQVSRPR